MTEHFDLGRFTDAQEQVYERVLAELSAGRKTSHWMWFIFPQLRGIGSSATALHFGITSIGEARAYLAHPVLGARLRECTQLINAISGRSIEQIFGYPDDLKFRSSMTLFRHAAQDDGSAAGQFALALEKFFQGEEDSLTRELLS
jgi:uncharacterized protein (DUF1810 family)